MMDNISKYDINVVSKKKGLVLSLCLIIGLKIWEILWIHIFEIGTEVNNLTEATFRVFIDISLILIVLLIIRYFSFVKFTKSVFNKNVRFKTLLCAIFFGLIINIPALYKGYKLSYLFLLPGYRNFYTITLFSPILRAPIVEEFIFRGILFISLKSYNKYLGYILSNIIFVIWHFSISSYYYDDIINLSITYIISLFLFGLVASYLYDKSGSLKMPLIYHLTINLIINITPIVGYLSRYKNV